jgi:hypothetical protein
MLNMSETLGSIPSTEKPNKPGTEHLKLDKNEQEAYWQCGGRWGLPQPSQVLQPVLCSPQIKSPDLFVQGICI